MDKKELEFMRETVNDLFPDFCNLLSPTRVSDGAGGSTQSWGTVTRNVPCRVDTLFGTEHQRVGDGSARAFESLELCVPYDTALTSAMRVEHSGTTYNVIHISTDQSWPVEKSALLERIT